MNADPNPAKAIFLEAVEKHDSDQWPAFLDRACAGQPALRRRVEVLLVAHREAGTGQHPAGAEGAASSPVATIDEPPVREHPGTVIGPYKLLEQIGEGGFGVVFMAEQQERIRRKVALKILKPGMDTRQVIARFEAERQALALMDHPNIAKVLDAGTVGSRQQAAGSEKGASLLPAADCQLPAAGRPYFVMELVRGLPITDYCDQTQLTPRERLELFLPVCQAVQHAHQKGIIHRDIKPSNVLVTLHDGTPVPKVIDFGIAKALGQQLTDKTLFTSFAQMIGTPLYMSPEQAALSNVDVDTRSDIYSLGVLLYELLTGTTPFDKERFKEVGYDELRRIIREEEPPKPSTRLRKDEGGRMKDETKQTKRTRWDWFTPFSSFIPHPSSFQELDWIVMKCLEKDRNRRYETANSLARDIQRYLNDEPVQACPPSLRYRVRKFGRKHGKLLATAAAFAALLITLAVGTTASAWRLGVEKEATSQQLQETLKAQDQTKLELYHSLVAQARANRLSRRSGRRVRSLEILAEATRLARELQLSEEDFLELRNETIACLPLVDLRVARSWEGYPAGTAHMDFDGNLERYVRFDHLKGVASVRRVADDSEVCRITEFARSKYPWHVVLSPDGQFLGRVDIPFCKVWKVTSEPAEPLLEKPGIELRFSPDSRHLAIARQDGLISVYELVSGKELRQWQTGPLSRNYYHLAFHPEKPQLAVRNPGKIAVLDLDTGNKLAEFAHPRGVDALEWLPDGKRLASADVDHCIYLWEAYTGKSLGRLAGHTNDGIRVAIHPAGDLLASICWDRKLRLWDVRTGQELFKTSWEAAGNLHSLRFSRDGRLLAADVADHQLRLWEVIPACGYRNLVREPHLGKTSYGHCAVSGKHPLLAIAMEDGVGLWGFPSGRPVAFLPIGTDYYVAFEPSGALLTLRGGLQRRWPIEALGPPGTLRIGPPQPLPFPPSSEQIATNRDGRVMASAHYWGALVWRADKSDELIPLRPQHDVRFVAVSPEGEWIATGSHSATDVYVKVWDARTGRHVADLPVEKGGPIGFSPDGRWLLTTGGGCPLWAVGTWREWPKIGGTEHVFAFSPDSKVLARETGSGSVRLLDPDTGREYARLEDPNQDRAHTLVFSQDGSQLVASTHEGSAVHVWDLRAIGAELAQRGLDWDLPPYPLATKPNDVHPLQLTVDLGDSIPKKEALELNDQAWVLATNPEAKLRDPDRAVELAQKAVDLCPKQAMYWNTLGVAHYRAGHWKDAITALTKSMELRKGAMESSFGTFSLAMAHWRLDEKEMARQWYDRAVQWMEMIGSHNNELRLLRAEAEELLEIKKN
jgi:serine/threonine protein kinase/WD40 repeat protein